MPLSSVVGFSAVTGNVGCACAVELLSKFTVIALTRSFPIRPPVIVASLSAQVSGSVAVTVRSFILIVMFRVICPPVPLVIVPLLPCTARLLAGFVALIVPLFVTLLPAGTVSV